MAWSYGKRKLFEGVMEMKKVLTTIAVLQPFATFWRRLTNVWRNLIAAGVDRKASSFKHNVHGGRSRLNLLILLTLGLVFAADSGMAQPKTTPIHPQDDVTSCNPHNFRVAVDVGHTREAPGAMSSSGVTEHTFNLALGKNIEALLREASFDTTFLIIAKGSGKSQLNQRSAYANSMMVDLFLSIHHDDVQPKYYAKWNYNGREYHFSDKFSGFSIFASQLNVYSNQSLYFGKLLGAELIGRGMHFTTHHSENIPGERRQLIDPEHGVYRYDQLVVLKTTKAPAVLLEAGIIVNRNEEALLSSPEHQGLIAAAVVDAVKQFCGKQGSKREVDNVVVPPPSF
jgi:N-acetylmuramoyl-L-alanine amidase